LSEELLKALSKGVFFNVRVLGIRRMATLLRTWEDEFTEIRTVRHLFSRISDKVRRPTPRYFAMLIPTLGWWTTESLYKARIKEYREKLDKIKADFFEKIEDPFVLARFEEISKLSGRDPETLLRSIRFITPAKKIDFIWYDDEMKQAVTQAYKKDIERRLLKIIRDTRRLLIHGVRKRKIRIKNLIEASTVLQTLNTIGLHKSLIQDLAKVVNAVINLNPKAVPNLSRYLNNANLPKNVKDELKRLIDTFKIKEYWRFR